MLRRSKTADKRKNIFFSTILCFCHSTFDAWVVISLFSFENLVKQLSHPCWKNWTSTLNLAWWQYHNFSSSTSLSIVIQMVCVPQRNKSLHIFPFVSNFKLDGISLRSDNTYWMNTNGIGRNLKDGERERKLRNYRL